MKGSCAHSRVCHLYHMAKLTSGQIKAVLPSVKDWKKQKAEIKRTFEFKDFAAAMQFVDKVARAAEKANHHPDIDIRWNKVTLALSTHSEGGLTQNDFDLARKIDALV
ncbi:MAG TPA: 4a-hydroxytetrahydrobiopterin dehydratase [Candidatus Acidoferrum sp.]|nr:4a-hydroxytetrahydrobiopterin dehydratase [Candidatus Acidoferrum sp.]